MVITVDFMGVLQDSHGKNRKFEVKDNLTVSEFLEKIYFKGEMIHSLLIIRDNTFINKYAILKDGDKIRIATVVGGG